MRPPATFERKRSQRTAQGRLRKNRQRSRRLTSVSNCSSGHYHTLQDTKASSTFFRRDERRCERVARQEVTRSAPENSEELSPLEQSNAEDATVDDGVGLTEVSEAGHDRLNDHGKFRAVTLGQVACGEQVERSGAGGGNLSAF